MRRFRFRHSPALAVLVTALVVTLGGAAYATIPDSAGVIHGCYKIGGEGFDSQRGSLRVIDTDSGQSCRKHETALTWNQTGPQGPAGPQGNTGAQGPEGPQGVQGAPGLSGYVVSTNSAVVGGLSTIHGAATVRPEPELSVAASTCRTTVRTVMDTMLRTISTRLSRSRPGLSGLLELLTTTARQSPRFGTRPAPRRVDTEVV